MITEFTGHPLIDVGLAALTVMSGRALPDDLGPDDCETVADWLFSRLYTTYDATSELYTQGPFKSYLIWLFPNAVWVNNLSKDAQRTSASLRAYAQETLYAFAMEADPEAIACNFCGRPSVRRVSRSVVPLLSGKYPNFNPAGEVGVPACGLCLLAVHALPLGGVATEGRRLMAMHSSNSELLMQMTRWAVDHNRAAMHQARLADWPQLPYPRTRLVARQHRSRQHYSQPPGPDPHRSGPSLVCFALRASSDRTGEPHRCSPIRHHSRLVYPPLASV